MFLNKIYPKEAVLRLILYIVSFFLFLSLVGISYVRINKLFLLQRPPGGDEGVYLKALLTANSSGIPTAISQGCSLPFLFFSYLLDAFLKNPLISIRTTSLLSGITLVLISIFITRKKLGLNNYYGCFALLALLNLLVVRSNIFAGINDVLLAVFGLLFMISFHNFLKYSKTLIIPALLMSLIIITRKMAISYLLVFEFIFLCFIIFAKPKNRNFNLKAFIKFNLLSILFFLIFNLYGLINFGQLTWEDKSLPAKINWAQWDYYNAMLIDKGLQERDHHIAVEETIIYLEKNGQKSLPSNFLEMIYFDPILTIKEFFFDFFTSWKYILRLLALLIFIYPYVLIHSKFKKVNLKFGLTAHFWYAFAFSYVLFISFAVIANIQPRWFTFFLPFIIYLLFMELSKFEKKYTTPFLLTNNLLLLAWNLPFLIKHL